MQNTIVITLGKEGDLFDYLTEYAKEKGLNVVRKPVSEQPDEVRISALKGAAALVAGVESYSGDVLKALQPELKFITRFGVGYDKIDLAAAKELGIPVANTPGANSAGVADLALTMIMALGRQLLRVHRETSAGMWEQWHVTHELEGKTIGLVGFGQIARRLAKYLSGFSCKLLVHDDYVDDLTLVEWQAQRVSLDELAKQSDFVSLHLPLTPQTEHMIDKGFFAKMKSTAFLINTSRGPIVAEEDLIDALKRGIIAGAGLDVYSTDPIGKDNPLLLLDNVILSPHSASHTEESIQNTGRMAIDNIVEFFSTGGCAHIVNG